MSGSDLRPPACDSGGDSDNVDSPNTPESYSPDDYQESDVTVTHHTREEQERVNEGSKSVLSAFVSLFADMRRLLPENTHVLSLCAQAERTQEEHGLRVAQALSRFMLSTCHIDVPSCTCVRPRTVTEALDDIILEADGSGEGERGGEGEGEGEGVYGSNQQCRLAALKAFLTCNGAELVSSLLFRDRPTPSQAALLSPSPAFVAIEKRRVCALQMVYALDNPTCTLSALRRRCVGGMVAAGGQSLSVLVPKARTVPHPSSPFVVYSISVAYDGQRWSILKRYSQIKALFDAMRATGFPLRSLKTNLKALFPKKTYTRHATDASVVEERRDKFDTFFKTICSPAYEAVQRMRCFRQFLQLSRYSLSEQHISLAIYVKNVSREMPLMPERFVLELLHILVGDVTLPVVDSDDVTLPQTAPPLVAKKSGTLKATMYNRLFEEEKVLPLYFHALAKSSWDVRRTGLEALYVILLRCSHGALTFLSFKHWLRMLLPFLLFSRADAPATLDVCNNVAIQVAVAVLVYYVRYCQHKNTSGVDVSYADIYELRTSKHGKLTPSAKRKEENEEKRRTHAASLDVTASSSSAAAAAGTGVDVLMRQSSSDPTNASMGKEEDEEEEEEEIEEKNDYLCPSVRRTDPFPSLKQTVMALAQCLARDPQTLPHLSRTSRSHIPVPPTAHALSAELLFRTIAVKTMHGVVSNKNDFMYKPTHAAWGNVAALCAGVRECVIPVDQSVASKAVAMLETLQVDQLKANATQDPTLTSSQVTAIAATQRSLLKHLTYFQKI